MRISEILKKEGKNTGSIFLFKEGLFWRAYEHSAFLFVQHIKKYSITKKYYKNVNTEVVYCGFPENTLNEILKLVENKTISKKDKQIIISGFDINKQEFEKWKGGIAAYQKSEGMASSPCSHYEKIIEKIKMFGVVNKTPIECQQFLIELQSELSL